MLRLNDSNAGAKIRAAVRDILMIALLLGGNGCGSGSEGVNVVNSGAPISINDPANGFSTTATSITITGFVNRSDGAFPNGTIYWSNGNYSGSTSAVCGFLCCLFVCTGSWQATVPLNVGTNTITATFEGASTSVTVTRIPVFSVSGAAFMLGTNAPLVSPDVTISRTDPASSTIFGTYLDTSGRYTFTGLLAGSYTLSPHFSPPESPSCLAFTPASRTITVSTTDVSGQDFAATLASPCYSIRGRITSSSSGNGVNNVDVYLKEDASGQTMVRVTNSTGYYEFNYLPPASYTVTPQSCVFLSCNTFTPANASVTITNADVNGQDFVEQF